MASATRHVSKRHKAMPTIRQLDKLRVVITPQARSLLADEKAVRAAIRRAVAKSDDLLPEEVLLWTGSGEDRVVALINRHVRTIYVERMGVPGGDPRKDALTRIVDLGIGSRPDLPSGVEYVRRVRGIWRGLIPD